MSASIRTGLAPGLKYLHNHGSTTRGEVERKQRSAFITTRQGFCYLTIKIGRRNHHLCRIRHYTLEAQEKRDLRRWHPDIVFDWKKIEQPRSEKREVCRGYRSRRQRAAAERRCPRTPKPLFFFYETLSSYIYTDGDLRSAGALLDAVLQIDRAQGSSITPWLPAKPAEDREK